MYEDRQKRTAGGLGFLVLAAEFYRHLVGEQRVVFYVVAVRE